MIVDKPLRAAGMQDESRSKRLSRPRTPPLLGGLLCFAGLFLLALTLQIASGAYQSEFGGYPDEPAHYVTGLMVHDYIARLAPASPMEFAQDYYAHYPKVAFGHWPPLLYAVQAVWMLAFSASRASVLVEMAFLTALLGWSLFHVARRYFGTIEALLSAVLLVALPLIQMYTDEIMAEILLVLVSFWALVFFARYLETENWRDSFWFGVFSSLAILTKGNGWALAMVPPVVLILLRRYRILLRPSFWTAASVVAVLCGPWQVMTMSMARRGWTGGEQPNLTYTIQALGEFFWVLVAITGPALAVLAGLGILIQVVLPAFRKMATPFWSTMAAAILAVWVFHAVVPAGIESRKMIVAAPPLVLFLFAGARWILDRIPLFTRRPFWKEAGFAALVGLVFITQTFAIPKETCFGFVQAADFLMSRPDLRNQVVLVSSERDGEGLLISEIAMRQHPPGPTILRASKVLSRTDWNGGAYEEFYHSPDELMNFLKENRVRILVLDTFPARVAYLHQAVLREAIRKSADHFRLVGTFPGSGPNRMPGAVEIYQLSY